MDRQEAEMCGNGIRCFAKLVLERKIATIESALTVETKDGIKLVEPLWRQGRVVSARVDMGLPRFLAEEIPVRLTTTKTILTNILFNLSNQSLSLTCLSMGNPHAVAFLDDPIETFPLADLGPRIQNDLMFPQSVNFEIVNVISPDHVKARTWERGAGETWACGTGACAIAVAGQLTNVLESRVEIDMTGGTLAIEWNGQDHVYMSGPAKQVFEGEWTDSRL